jgi:hypothetical protein
MTARRVGRVRVTSLISAQQAARYVTKLRYKAAVHSRGTEATREKRQSEKLRDVLHYSYSSRTFCADS